MGAPAEVEDTQLDVTKEPVCIWPYKFILPAVGSALPNQQLRSILATQHLTLPLKADQVAAQLAPLSFVK